MGIMDMLNKIVSISLFNQGHASKLFQRANKGDSLIVVKNNSPIAIIISPEEYELFQSLIEMCECTNKGTSHGVQFNSKEMAEIVAKLRAIEKSGEQKCLK